MPVKVRDLIRTLEDAGWRHVRTAGDHRIFQTPMATSQLCRGNSETMCGPGPIARFCGRLVSRRLTADPKYSLVIEGDAAGYSGYVPELPTILVTGSSIDELTSRAKEGVRLYWESLRTDMSPESTVQEIEVDLPA